MEQRSKLRVALSRRLLFLVVAVGTLQPILEVHAQEGKFMLLFRIPGCHAVGKICDDFDGMFISTEAKFTTSRINYCLDKPNQINLVCSKQGCLTSQCMPKLRSKRDKECRVVNMRDEYAKKNHTLNAYQEDCSSTEEKIVCCQPDAVEAALLAGYGAEAHEFPHQVLLLKSNKMEDRSSGYNPTQCGGTIYNEKYILTAAHCAVDKYDHPTYADNKPGQKKLQYSEAHEPKQIEVVVGTNIGMTARASNRYRVERVIVHPNYTHLKNNTDAAIRKGDVPIKIQYDLALLKIKGTIKLNKYTKALRMPPPNFRPQEYAEKVVIVGWGTTDNLQVTEYLQKSDLKIRNENNLNACDRLLSFKSDQHLCIGGMIDNVEFGKTAGGGDSGGPAICRDKNGFGVLCGITSFGADDEDCNKMPSMATCLPSVYADVSYFRPWIIGNAGAQDRGKTQFHRAPLYGVDAGDELAQVKITSGDGKACGGTLVSADTVVTASNCAYDEKNALRKFVVKFGSAEYFMKSVTLLLNAPGQAGRSVVNQEFYKKWRKHKQYLPLKIEEPYYDVNIVVIKLLKKVSGVQPATLSTSKLVESGDTVYEAAWMRNSSFALRKFPSSVISRENCQRRYDRLSKKNLSFPIGHVDVCMVENYSGGNFCDRELGGGVFCSGPKGRTLCGVQVFRMCDYSAPKIIADIHYYADNLK